MPLANARLFVVWFVWLGVSAITAMITTIFPSCYLPAKSMTSFLMINRQLVHESFRLSINKLYPVCYLVCWFVAADWGGYTHSVQDVRRVFPWTCSLYMIESLTSHNKLYNVICLRTTGHFPTELIYQYINPLCLVWANVGTLRQCVFNMKTLHFATCVFEPSFYNTRTEMNKYW